MASLTQFAAPGSAVQMILVAGDEGRRRKNCTRILRNVFRGFGTPLSMGGVRLHEIRGCCREVVSFQARGQILVAVDQDRVK